jgi:hypothetical protein
MADALQFDVLSDDVGASLEEWRRIRQHEADRGPNDWSDCAAALAVERLIYAMHQQWALWAEELLARVRIAAQEGLRLPARARLEDALGRTQSRLLMTPEMTARAMEQEAEGKFISVKELRDQLHARRRA